MSSPSMTAPRARRLPRGDSGDVILSWLTKVGVLLAVLGVMLFDVISVGSAQFQVEEQAQQAARRAAQSFAANKDIQVAYESALSDTAPGDTIDPASFTVDPAGAVTLTMQRDTPTLLIEKIPPLRDYASISRTVQASPLR